MPAASSSPKAQLAVQRPKPKRAQSLVVDTIPRSLGQDKRKMLEQKN
jgi:hypothetical protein